MKIVCSQCLSTNNVPRERLSDGPICGKCKNSLLPAHPVELTDETFATFVARTEIPVVVDFWAAWCGPCKMIAPHLEELAKELGEKVQIVKVNIDENPLTPTKYGVRGVPTLMVFKNGELAATKVGALPKTKLLEWVQKRI